MSADKTVKALFVAIEQELSNDGGTSGAIATAIVKQIGNTLISEMKSKQDFADRIAQILDPNFMPSPVAIVQKSGRGALVLQLGKLAPAQIKKIGTGRNLVAGAEVKGLGKDELIELIATRAAKEANSQQRP